MKFREPTRKEQGNPKHKNEKRLERLREAKRNTGEAKNQLARGLLIYYQPPHDQHEHAIYVGALARCAGLNRKQVYKLIEYLEDYRETVTPPEPYQITKLIGAIEIRSRGQTYNYKNVVRTPQRAAAIIPPPQTV